MKTTMTHVIVPAQPGWFLAVFTTGNGAECVRFEPIIAWEVQRTTSSNGLVARFPLPITAERTNDADLDCMVWGIKRPDGKLVFPVAANEGISEEKKALNIKVDAFGNNLAALKTEVNAIRAELWSIEKLAEQPSQSTAADTWTRDTDIDATPELPVR